MNVSVRDFTFHNTQKTESLSVRIPEVVDAAYGLYIWPCAPVLAQYMWQNRDNLMEKTVLELGAGTALPGIVAAKCGAKVILSDNASFKNCLDICQQAAALNDATSVSVVGITWGHITPTVLSLPPIDLVLASDCFYDSKDFEDVAMTFSYLLHKNPSAEIWCAYQERSSERCIEHLLDKWSLCGQELELPNMETLESTFDGYTRHIIQLYAIRLKSKVPSYSS